MQHIIRQRDDNNSNKHDAAPIERLRRWVTRLRPTSPEQDKRTVHESNRIHKHAIPTQTPAAVWKQLGAQGALVEYASDGDGVGRHQGHKL